MTKGMQILRSVLKDSKFKRSNDLIVRPFIVGDDAYIVPFKVLELS